MKTEGDWGQWRGCWGSGVGWGGKFSNVRGESKKQMPDVSHYTASPADRHIIFIQPEVPFMLIGATKRRRRRRGWGCVWRDQGQEEKGEWWEGNVEVSSGWDGWKGRVRVELKKSGDAPFLTLWGLLWASSPKLTMFKEELQQELKSLHYFLKFKLKWKLGKEKNCFSQSLR